MKSIKPGRGPSGISFAGSIIAIIFGVFWTIIAASMMANAPFGIIGMILPLFGVLFIIMGIIQALYNYKNATGKNRYSIFEITEEEGDPSDQWIKRGIESEEENEQQSFIAAEANYCPYCGIQLEQDYTYCPKCGKAKKAH
jgi:vacuolar-type H+-ATPase subunit I/STV1